MKRLAQLGYKSSHLMTEHCYMSFIFECFQLDVVHADLIAAEMHDIDDATEQQKKEMDDNNMVRCNAHRL